MRFIDALRKPFPYRRYNMTLALIIVNVGMFIISQLNLKIYTTLALSQYGVFDQGYFWQIFTYMFLHDINGYGHIFFNMLGLYMFGMMIEDRLGSIEFLLFYLFSGIGAGLAILFLNPAAVTVGASGAIYALLLAFAAMFPEARILLFFFIPMKAPFAVLVFAGISLFFLITGTAGNISHIGHLAGILFGFIYLVVRLNINPIKIFFGKNRIRF